MPSRSSRFSKSRLSNWSWLISALLNLLKASSPQTDSALTLSITNRHSASDAIRCLWAFRFRVIAPRLKVLQNAARTQRRAVLDVHPHLVRVFQFPAQMARVMGRVLIHESLS